MKRLDLFFVAALALLAGFVGSEAYEARSDRQPTLIEPGLADVGGATVMTSAGASEAPADERVKSRPAVPRRADIRPSPSDVYRRLALGAPGTYIHEVLASRDSSLARWPDRRMTPLRVWIQSAPRVNDWNPLIPSIVRDAFTDWSETGIPLSFTFVLDSASADVHVTFIDRFDEQISGKTLWAHDDDWWIVEANIVLAVHHSSGEILDVSATRAIALHEVGHLIGLDHTANPANVMTPRVRVKDLSPADRATAQLIYMLPPGPVHGIADKR